jgi:hypothetical protein
VAVYIYWAVQTVQSIEVYNLYYKCIKCYWLDFFLSLKYLGWK